ncbi:MAG: bifunctional oligoribonuclease/PAP phosphatase NrnA [bacterium]
MFSAYEIQLNRAIYLFKKSQKVILTCHQKPDGDCVGSMLALQEALKQINKNVLAISVDPLPNRLDFLPGIKNILIIDEAKHFITGADLVVAVDCELNRSGLEKYISQDTLTISIDHHHDNQKSATVNVINDLVSATAEIIYKFYLKIGLPVNRDVATNLLTGIFVDTDGFQNPNTSAETLEIVSKLFKTGAKISEIARETSYEKPLSTLRLWGRILARLQYNRKFGIITTVATKKDLEECGASASELEGIANYLNAIPGVKITAVVTEQGDGEIKGSLRTIDDNIDVSRLASLFGGGGHKKAAGFTIPGQLQANGQGWKII